MKKEEEAKAPVKTPAAQQIDQMEVLDEGEVASNVSPSTISPLPMKTQSSFSNVIDTELKPMNKPESVEEVSAVKHQAKPTVPPQEE